MLYWRLVLKLQLRAKWPGPPHLNQSSGSELTALTLLRPRWSTCLGCGCVSCLRITDWNWSTFIGSSWSAVENLWSFSLLMCNWYLLIRFSSFCAVSIAAPRVLGFSRNNVYFSELCCNQSTTLLGASRCNRTHVLSDESIFSWRYQFLWIHLYWPTRFLFYTLENRCPIVSTANRLSPRSDGLVLLWPVSMYLLGTLPPPPVLFKNSDTPPLLGWNGTLPPFCLRPQCA